MATKNEAALLPQLRPKDTNTHLIWVLCFLKSAISAELMRVQFERELKKARFRSMPPTCEALWNGHRALEKESENCVQELRERGQLLFAFAGTTVLEGGAA